MMLSINCHWQGSCEALQSADHLRSHFQGIHIGTNQKRFAGPPCVKGTNHTEPGDSPLNVKALSLEKFGNIGGGLSFSEGGLRYSVQITACLCYKFSVPLHDFLEINHGYLSLGCDVTFQLIYIEVQSVTENQMNLLM